MRWGGRSARAGVGGGRPDRPRIGDPAAAAARRPGPANRLYGRGRGTRRPAGPGPPGRPRRPPRGLGGLGAVAAKGRARCEGAGRAGGAGVGALLPPAPASARRESVQGTLRAPEGRAVAEVPVPATRGGAETGKDTTASDGKWEIA